MSKHHLVIDPAFAARASSVVRPSESVWFEDLTCKNLLDRLGFLDMLFEHGLANPKPRSRDIEQQVAELNATGVGCRPPPSETVLPLIESLDGRKGEPPRCRFASQVYRVGQPVFPSQVPWFEHHRDPPQGRSWESVAFANRARLSDLLQQLSLHESMMKLVVRVVRALELNQPLLVEGPRAAAKTSAVELACALRGMIPVRVNFSASTDATDTVGKFVPSTERKRPFEWADGPVLRAMKKPETFVLYFDEMNLAMPGLQDRLLPLLEPARAFLVTEHRGEAVASPDLRVVASMNSADEAGRSALSNPMRSRFAAHFVGAPEANDFEQALRHLTLGSPTASFGGTEYALDDSAPKYSCVGDTHGWKDLVPRLARFLSDLAKRVNDGSLGATRPERYAFDFRTAIRLLDAFHQEAQTGADDVTPVFASVFDEVFVQAVAPADRDAVLDLAKAHHLHPLPPKTLVRRATVNEALGFLQIAGETRAIRIVDRPSPGRLVLEVENEPTR